MKTKPVTIIVEVPDDGKDYTVCVNVADATPPGQSDYDRLRPITRTVWSVTAGSQEAGRVG